MRGLVLFIFFVLITMGYQNCSENETAISNSGTNISCEPDNEHCLKFRLELSDLHSNKQTASACLFTLATENGESDVPPSFSTGCTKYNDTCYHCLVNEPHQVSFNVSAEKSKAGIYQSITIIFTPSGFVETITNFQ